MSYKGKTVIRLLGRISNRQRTLFLEYADHTTERVDWTRQAAETKKPRT